MNNDTPAFPAGSIRKTRQRPHDAGSDFIVSDTVEPKYKGVTIRDYFAAKALAGIEASQGNNSSYLTKCEEVAQRAYRLADAMLEAREDPCPTKT